VQIPQPKSRRPTTVVGILPILRVLARDHASIIGFSSRERLRGWISRFATRCHLVDIRPEEILLALLAEGVVCPEDASGILFIDSRRARRWVHVLSSPITISDLVPRRPTNTQSAPCILPAEDLYAALRLGPS
jgi:hypothetical protein